MEIQAALQIENTKDRVKKAINEAVRLKWEQERVAMEIKDIADMLKEELEIKPADFNALVNTIFNDDLKKKKDKLEQLEEAISLYKGNSEEEEE